MAPLNRDIIEQIRRRTDILSVVGRYVSLTKKGKNYWGICPFHKEAAPSFKVNPENGFYYCFGCKASGTVFNFIMEIEGKSFRDVLEELAPAAGVALPSSIVSIGAEEGAEPKVATQNYYDINRIAAEFYAKLLNSSEGKIARDYLAARGYEKQISERFKLGYGGDGWDSLSSFLKRNGASLEIASKLGLVVAGSGGNYYDRFRERLIFPIIDVRGRVIGFGGRILDDAKETAKYVNSSDSPIYNKSRVFYGLSESRQEIKSRGYAILVEGYFDFLRVFQAGIESVLAVCGTALTPYHCEILARYTGKVKILMDSDSAGQKAAFSACKLLVSAGLETEAITLSEGEDPDSFIKKEGVLAFEKRVEEAASAVDFAFEYLKKLRGGLKTIEDKVAIAEDIGQLLNAFRNTMTRDLYISHVAEKLGIEEKLVRRSLSGRSPYPHEYRSGVSQRAVLKLNQVEQHYLRLAAISVLQPGIAALAVDDEILTNITPLELQEVFIRLSELVNEGEKIIAASLIEEMPPSFAQKLLETYNEFEEGGEDNYFNIWTDVLFTVKKNILLEKKKLLLEDMKNAPEDPQIKTEFALVQERLKILREDVTLLVKKVIKNTAVEPE